MKLSKQTLKIAPFISSLFNHVDVRNRGFLRNRYGRYRVRMTALMLFADIFGFTMAGSILLIINVWAKLFVFQLMDLRYTFILPICIILYTSTKLYPGIGINPAEEIQLVFIQTCLGFLIVFLTFDTKTTWSPNFWAFVSFGFFSISTALCMRWLVRVLAVQANLWGEPVAVLARGSQINQLMRYFFLRRRLGFLPVLAVTDLAGKKANTNPVPVIDLRHLFAKDSSSPMLQNVETVLVDASLFGRKLRGAPYSRLFSLFRHVIFVSDMGWMEGASLQTHDFEGLIGIEARGNVLSPTSSAIKRIMDIVGSLLGMLLSAPFMILLTALIKLDSPGPVFYAQARVGRNGKNIRIYKFRTMVVKADQILDDYLKINSSARHEWRENHKLHDDPRITRVGKFLRAYSIDEIPQLTNVLFGDMSLVGPRPLPAYHHQALSQPLQDLRTTIKPGITGMWQVSGRSNTGRSGFENLDVYYLRNWSVWLDIYILARTVWVVLTREGAF